MEGLSLLTCDNAFITYVYIKEQLWLWMLYRGTSMILENIRDLAVLLCKMADNPDHTFMNIFYVTCKWKKSSWVLTVKINVKVFAKTVLRTSALLQAKASLPATKESTGSWKGTSGTGLAL